MFLSENLKKCRERMSLTLDELSRDLEKAGLNISRQTILNWETGTSAPDGNDIAILSKFFDKPVQYFFG